MRVGLVVGNEGVQAVRRLVEVVEGRGAARLVEDGRVGGRSHMSAAGQDEARFVNVIISCVVGALGSLGSWDLGVRLSLRLG